MRNRIKISVVPVAIAWMVIFMHGVISHNHVNELMEDCSAIVHCSHEVSQDIQSHFIPETNHEDNHSLICHFTTSPYNHLDNDSNFLIVTEESVLPTAEDINKSYITSHFSFAEQERHTPVNRRGPPSLLG